MSGCRLEKQEGLCWIGCGGQYENKRRAIRDRRAPFRTLSNAGSSLTSVSRHMGPRLDGFLDPHVGLNKPFKQRRSCRQEGLANQGFLNPSSAAWQTGRRQRPEFFRDKLYVFFLSPSAWSRRQADYFTEELSG